MEDIQQFTFKIRVRAEGECPNPMWLQLSGYEHGVNCTGGQAQFDREGTHRPPAPIIGLLADTRLHLVPDVGAVSGRTSRTRRVAWSLNTVDGERATPLPHRDNGDLQPAAIR
jgi:hypothetical protein